MLAPSQTVQDLQRARNLIADPQKWCRYQLRDGMGYCAHGALKVDAAGDYCPDMFNTRLHFAIDDAAVALFPQSMDQSVASAAWVNDTLGHDAVMRVYDRAIQLAMAGEPVTP